MSVEYQNKSEVKVTANATSITIPIPTGFSAGDLLIAIVVKDDDPAIVLPTGGTWTLIQGGTGADPQMHFSVSYRIAEAGDTEWTWTGDSEVWYGVILRYTGQANSGFIHASGKADGDSTAPTAPSVDYTDLEAGSIAIHCFGQDYDRIPYTSPDALIERYNDEAGGCGGAGGEKATIIDSQTQSNLSINFKDGISAISQSFTGTNNTLTVARFELLKLGSPSGSAVAKLYSHTGTYGSSSVPGTLLATSESINFSDIAGTQQFYNFQFKGSEVYQLGSGTYYCIVLEATEGTTSNYIVCRRANSDVHSGNASTYDGSWTAQSGYDLVFYTQCGYISGSGSTGTAIFTTDASDEWLAVTVVIEALAGAVTHEIQGASNGIASFTTLGSVDWEIISAIDAFNQTVGALSANWKIDSIVNGILSNSAFLKRTFSVNGIIDNISSTTGNLELWKLITGAINAINQIDGNLIANRNLIGEIDAVNQLITALTKMQTYNFDFSYNDGNWDLGILGKAIIQNGVLDIVNLNGYGTRYPDANWYSGANDNFEIEIDFKQDDLFNGAQTYIKLIDDGKELSFSVDGLYDEMNIYYDGVERASQEFIDDTSWHTMKVRRVGTTFYFSIDSGNEISWDYGTARAVDWFEFKMLGVTGDFDNLKWKWEEPFYLRSGINTISSTITNLEIWKLIAGAINGLSSLTSSIQADWEISGILNSIALLTNIAKVERTINGTSDAISNFISLMSADWKIDSTIDGISSNIAFLKRIFSVNSIINSISSTIGSLEIWKLIIGIVNALSSTTGNIFLDRNIVSSVNALSETISSIIANYALSVETNGVSQTISNILLDRSIIGASNALSQTISNVIVNWQITSAINGISQTDAIAKLDMAIISAINGLASTTGDLTQFGTILIEGIANGLSQLISKINTDWSINGTLQGQSNYISLLNADWQINSNIDGISITDGFLKRNFIVDGMVNGLSITAGHTIISRLINSIITGQTTFDGILKADWSLFGDINSLSQTDGIIYLDKSIIGTINGVSELVSAIIADWSINGISSANAQTTANLIALYELLGTIDGIASTTGILTLTGEILLAGIIDVLALLSGLGKVDWNISGNTDAISQMDANIIANWTLLGNINPLSQTLGDLTLLTEILLAGIISALTQLYGKTNVNKLIGGTFQGQSSNIALLSTIYQILGTTQGQSILDALLGKLFSIDGTSQGITTINGLTRIDYSIDGLINGQGQTIGNILRDISLYGTSNAYALLSGNVLLEKLIASIINGVASLDGTLQQVIIARLITEILKGNSIITKEIFLNSDITKQKDLNSFITILLQKSSDINTN